MKIGLIQQAAGPDRQRNLERALHAMDRAKRAGAELVAFPELAIDRFFPARPAGPAGLDIERIRRLTEPIPGPTTQAIAAKAAALSLVTVFNLYEMDPQTGLRYDSSPVIDADGSLLGATRMVHITDYPCFHEKDYYTPGDRGAPVYKTRVGPVGVAICYDRHFPEYMRALGLGGADLVVIPQAGAVDEWPSGLFEAEVRTAAFQNGYFAALCNRVGEEEHITFVGESFVVDPDGAMVCQAKPLEEDLLVADVDLTQCERSHARRLFLRDRRPEVYREWGGAGK